MFSLLRAAYLCRLSRSPGMRRGLNGYSNSYLENCLTSRQGDLGYE